MKIETFLLERNQSLYENQVRFNLTESGLHPFSLRNVLSPEELAELSSLPLGYGQTNGDPALRRLIASRYTGVDEENVLLTNGSAEANFVAICALLERGDEVSMMLPNYMLVSGVLKSLGVNVTTFHLREALNWAPDMDELRKSITGRTRMIVICNPNNPTGAVLEKETMEEIASLARRVGAYILSDEIYRGSELDGAERPSFLDLYEKTLVCSGLSKALAFPGLRIGWIAGPKEVIARAWHLHDYTSISTSILSQYAARKILEPERRNKILAQGRAHLRRNLALFEEWLGRHHDHLRFIPPQAGGMAFAHYDFNIPSSLLVDRLRKQKSVFVVAGDWFGFDRYLRFGIGTESEKLKAGLSLVSEFFDGLA